MDPVMSGPFMVSARPGGGGRGRVGQECGGGGGSEKGKTLKSVWGKKILHTTGKGGCAEKKDVCDIRQIALLCTHIPVEGWQSCTGRVAASRKLASEGVRTYVCVKQHGSALSSQLPGLGVRERLACMNACECERPSLQDYFCSSRTRRGRPWRMKSSCHTCGRVHMHMRFHKGASHGARVPPPRVNLVMGIGGVTGICEGHQSLKSSICRLYYLYAVAAGAGALIINLFHQIHFIISPSSKHTLDKASSSWQSNQDKKTYFKIYLASRS